MPVPETGRLTPPAAPVNVAAAPLLPRLGRWWLILNWLCSTSPSLVRPEFAASVCFPTKSNVIQRCAGWSRAVYGPDSWAGRCGLGACHWPNPGGGWSAAGRHLSHQAGGQVQSWLRAHLTPPFLEHLSFSLGNQLFFIRVEDEAATSRFPATRGACCPSRMRAKTTPASCPCGAARE